MRQIDTLFLTLVALPFVTGCTTTQIFETSGEVAGALAVATLDYASDSPERRQRQLEERECVPGTGTEWSPCLPTMERVRQKAALDNRVKGIEARERRTEAEELRAEFDAFMQAREAVELPYADTPSVMVITK